MTVASAVSDRDYGRDMAEPRPFTVHVPDDVLTDLRGRLARSRIPEDSPRRPPSGMTAGYLRELVGTWIDWDWRAREAWLNRHPQYVVPVDGTDLHYVHAPALLVMHGWPHTFALQLDFADLLPDMHVVVASLPGFGFSTPYPDGPMTEKRLASTVHALMSDVLGHDRYLTYGEDVTANVSDLVAGIVRHARTLPDDRGARAAHRPRGQGLLRRHRRDPSHRRRVRPRPGDPTRHARGRAGRLPRRPARLADGEARGVERHADQPEPIPPTPVPAAVLVQRHEAGYPEQLARRHYLDLRVFDRLAEGGHFTVAEAPREMAPREMAARVRAFARSLDRT